MHPGQGFFYNRYAPPKGSAKLGTETDANVDQQLWYHVVGTPQTADKWVYAVPEHPDWFIGAEISHDGRRALFLDRSLHFLWTCSALWSLDALPDSGQRWKLARGAAGTS